MSPEDSVDALAGALPGGVAAPPPGELSEAGPTERDLEIFRETLDYALRERLDTLPYGETIVRIGRRFVGEPYTPGTLEVAGPERLVMNLREFDCVTYVEAVLAFARLIHTGRSDFGSFQEEVRALRYRGGRIEGYDSRLHYFSDWFHDNEEMGYLRDITRDLGGTPQNEPIDFMSSNAGSYPQLAEAATRDRIRRLEVELSARTRHYIPQNQIRGIETGIRNGDVIAATSSIRGLDVAHTGFAIWIDGRLHLMHAPLVGTDVEISARPLADRIRGITGQDGIMIARPLGS